MNNDDKRVPPITVASGKEEMVARLTELKDKLESGEVKCAALRVYKPDGTWEDVVLGGETDEERWRALTDLHRAYRAAH